MTFPLGFELSKLCFHICEWLEMKWYIFATAITGCTLVIHFLVIIWQILQSNVWKNVLDYCAFYQIAVLRWTHHKRRILIFHVILQWLHLCHLRLSLIPLFLLLSHEANFSASCFSALFFTFNQAFPTVLSRFFNLTFHEFYLRLHS